MTLLCITIKMYDPAKLFIMKGLGLGISERQRLEEIKREEDNVNNLLVIGEG